MYLLLLNESFIFIFPKRLSAILLICCRFFTNNNFCCYIYLLADLSYIFYLSIKKCFNSICPKIHILHFNMPILKPLTKTSSLWNHKINMFCKKMILKGSRKEIKLENTAKKLFGKNTSIPWKEENTLIRRQVNIVKYGHDDFFLPLTQN